jgi:anti-sigma-K factor RskA
VSRTLNPLWQDRLASEYVLGTLHGRARVRFQQLLHRDLGLCEHVAFWERELTPMASPLSVAAPSARVWQTIAARVTPRDRAEQAPHSWLARWFSMPTRGSLGSLAAGLFLGVCAALVGTSLLRTGSQSLAETQLPESYVGVLALADGRTGMLVSSRRHGRVMDLKRVLPVEVGADQTLHLWVIEADGKTRAVGPVPQGDFVHVELAQTSEQLFAGAVELALSIEPADTAPEQPSGPFVYRGLCGKLWRVTAPPGQQPAPQPR